MTLKAKLMWTNIDPMDLETQISLLITIRSWLLSFRENANINKNKICTNLLLNFKIKVMHILWSLNETTSTRGWLIESTLVMCSSKASLSRWWRGKQFLSTAIIVLWTENRGLLTSSKLVSNREWQVLYQDSDKCSLK